MTILFVLLSLILLFVAVVIAIAMGKPGAFSIQRSIAVRAAPESILPWIADFHRWTEWSPWESLDPRLQRTYSGAASGAGAVYTWAGRKSGSGSMEILEVESSRKVALVIRFLRPFRATNLTVFQLEPQGTSTFVTWTMSGPNTLVPGKILDVFLDKDQLIGKDFEKGLRALKRAVESPS